MPKPNENPCGNGTASWKCGSMNIPGSIGYSLYGVPHLCASTRPRGCSVTKPTVTWMLVRSVSVAGLLKLAEASIALPTSAPPIACETVEG